MKKLFLLALFAAFAVPQGAQADIVAGWDTFTQPDNGNVNNATTTLAGFSGGAVTDNNTWGQSGTGNSSDTTFGNDLAGASGAGSGLSLNNGATGFVDFTITNTTGSDYDLDFFHFDLGTTRPGAADDYTLSIVSGAVTAGAVPGGSGTNPNSGAAAPLFTGYDVSLSGLADNTLEDGQSVVFRLDFARGTTQGPAGHSQFVDNIALSATIASAVPEPSSLALLGLASMGLIARRRR